jgi:hypothetical protein
MIILAEIAAVRLQLCQGPMLDIHLKTLDLALASDTKASG